MTKRATKHPIESSPSREGGARFNPVATILAEVRSTAKSIGTDATIFILSLCVALLSIGLGGDVLKSVIGGLAFAVGWPFVKYLNALAERSTAKKKLDIARADGERMRVKHRNAKQNRIAKTKR